MIDWTILLCTFGADTFLAIGYGLAKWEDFIYEGRMAVLALMGVWR